MKIVSSSVGDKRDDGLYKVMPCPHLVASGSAALNNQD